MGAVSALRPIIGYLHGKNDLSLLMLCGDPAYGALLDDAAGNRNFEVHHLPETAANTGAPQFGRLVELCEAELESFRPTAVIGGLSGPDLGIDEALVAAAGPQNCISVQDWPGWVVRGAAGPAGCYLVASERAAKMTLDQGVGRAVLVGSLGRSAAFETPPPSEHISGETLFLGAPLHQLGGYGRTLLAFAAAMQLRGKAWRYRPHPRESVTEVKTLAGLLRSAGHEFHLTGSGSVFEELAEADLVVSCFSSALDDRLILGARVGFAPAAVLYLLHEPDVLRFYLENAAGQRPQAVQAGLAIATAPGDDVGAAIDHVGPPDAADVLALYPEPRPDVALRILLNAGEPDDFISNA